MACPLEIMMALHYHCIAGPYAAKDPNHAESVAVAEYHERFVRCEMLIDHGYDLEKWFHGSRYEATERLHVWVQHLIEVPFPVRMWVRPTNGAAGG